MECNSSRLIEIWLADAKTGDSNEFLNSNAKLVNMSNENVLAYFFITSSFIIQLSPVGIPKYISLYFKFNSVCSEM